MKLLQRTLFSAEHEAFRDAVLGRPGASEKIVSMLSGLETVKVASAIIESSIKKVSISL